MRNGKYGCALWGCGWVASGYNSAAFFSREFKKKFGCSPRELRRKAADNSIVLEAKSETLLSCKNFRAVKS